MSDSEPIRWTEPGAAGPAELRTLFQAGVDDLPSDEQVAALARKLGPVLDPRAGAGPSGASGAVRAKLGLAALGAVGLGVVAWVLASGPAPAPAPSATAVVSDPAPHATPRAPSVEPPAPLAPEPSSAPDPSRAPVSRESAPLSSVRAAAALPARPAETEAEFLERARTALGQNPSVALSLANQHRARYPSGVLAEEREVIAIEALKRLGRSAEVERRIEAFVRRYPGSAYRKKLDSGAGR